MSTFLSYILLLIPLPITLFFWYGTSGASVFLGAEYALMALGRLAGLLAVYTLLLQFLLRSRIPLLERTLGYETLNSLHKKNGYFSLLFIICHPILLTLGYGMTTGQDYFQQYVTFLTKYEDVFQAYIAMQLFVVVVASSVYIAKKRLKYEWWYGVHLLTYLAIFLAFGHQLQVGEDFLANEWFTNFWIGFYAVVFGAVFYWRWVKMFLLYANHRFFVDEIINETPDTVTIRIKGKELEKYSFEAGQFTFVRFLTKQLWWESHPFSFSTTKNNEYLQFTIKSEGDFTAKMPQIKKGTKVLLEDAHGNFVLRNAKRKKLLYIAGGVGITPIKAHLESMTDREAVLFYSNKTEKDILFRKDLQALSQKKNITIYEIVSRDTNFKGIQGRISSDLIKKYCKDLSSFEIFICGPVAMTNTLQEELRKVGIINSAIHSERFAL